MPITHEGYEDIFSSPSKWIMIPVNTFGVAGAGIALAMKQRSPSWFYYYKRACRKKEFGLDNVNVITPDDYPYGVITVPTKNHWKDQTPIEQVEKILTKVIEIDERKPFHSIAMPPIGCGRGELDYQSQVRPLVYKYLGNSRVETRVCFFQSNQS